MKLIFQEALIIMFIAIWLFNAVCMLFAPRIWLDLPDWYPKSSKYFLDRYSTRNAADLLELRFVGAIFLAAALGLGYHALTFPGTH